MMPTCSSAETETSARVTGRPVFPPPDLPAIAARRQLYWENGYRPVAVSTPDGDSAGSLGKRPLLNDWTGLARQNPPAAVVMPVTSNSTNTGFLLDKLLAVDLDIDDPEVAAEAERMTITMLGTGCLVRRRPNSARCLLLYRAEWGPASETLSGSLGKIELLGKGRQCVVDGWHPTGVPLKWTQGDPEDILRAWLPDVSQDARAAYIARARSLIGAKPVKAPVKIADNSEVDVADHEPDAGNADPADMKALVAAIANAGPANWEAWNNVGMAIYAATGGTGIRFWHTYSAKSPLYDSGKTQQRWNNYIKCPPTKTGINKLVKLAREAIPGWRLPSKLPTSGSEFNPLPSIDPLPGATRHDAKMQLTEVTHTGVAESFSTEYVGKLLYDHTDNKWMIFDSGIGWMEARTADQERAMTQFIKRYRAQWGEKQSLPAGAQSFAPSACAVLRRFAEFSVTSADWDTDPFVLGVPGGWVDLRTGQLQQADPMRRILRRTTVAPTDGACSTWTGFLHQATGGDLALLGFLQRFCGYCLTGDVREEILAFVYGVAGTGKGTFLHTIRNIMGAYAYQAPAALFKANSREVQSYQLAKLHGVRMLSASETEAGDAMAEAFVKEITGNEGAINARHPYGRPFEFEMRAKVLIVGNHAPSLKGRSDAMERRLKVVPFNHTPPAKDDTLKARLVAEYPAILGWMIEGCKMWQRDGLGSCDAVAEASRSYFDEQDTIGLWITEHCIEDRDVKSRSGELLEDFNRWSKPRGEPALTSKGFKEFIERRAGLACVHSNKGSMVRGLALRLRPADNAASERDLMQVEPSQQSQAG